VHLAGVALALAGLAIGVAGLFRGADRVTQILTVCTGATLTAGVVATEATPVAGAHEIAVVLPFGAVLAGRTLGPWLFRRPRPPIALATSRSVRPALAVALAGYLAALGYGASLSPRSAETQGLAQWLMTHNLTSGLGKYWAANSTTLASSGRVRVAATDGSGQAAYTWVTRPAWYEPSQSYANFVVAAPGSKATSYGVSEWDARRAFGPPAREYRYGTYVIMVWDKNLLPQVARPDWSKKP
jgi:hypothetical protein